MGTPIIAILIGLIAGIGGGLFGIGGGIIIVPCLVGFLGFSQHRAQGTSLVALLAPVGILSVMNYYKANELDFKVGAIIGAGFLVGAFGGSKLALNLDKVVMQRTFATFLIVVGIYMLVKK